MRHFFGWSICLALFADIGECQAAPLAGTQPNIILVITDDQGYGPLGRHGNTWINTPHLDRLHDASLRFDRFLVCPTCSPTRSAIMTGRHDMKNGITHTILERERMTLAATTLPQVLKTAGYTSAIFGKWHLGDEDAYQPQNRGFDEAFIHGAGGIGQAYNCSCADAPQNSYFDPVVRHNCQFLKTKGFCTDVFFTAALGWIHQQKSTGRPFFAYIATNAPHSPFLAPEKNRQRFEQMGFDSSAAGFYGMVENIDENMGRLVSRLEEWKLTDNTILIFMSDNGTTGGVAGKGGAPLGKTADGTPVYAWNDHMKGLKGSTDEGGVRVPFFVRWDRHLQAGREIPVIAAHIDILPTLAALAGANIPEQQVEGRNLLPLMENAQAEQTWPDRYLFSHVGRWPVGDEPNDHQWKKFGVRNQRYRLVENELFDMQTDPGQTRNIADQHPDVVQKMRSAYDAFWKATRPLMVNEGVEMSPTRPFWVAYERQLQASGIPEWIPASY